MKFTIPYSFYLKSSVQIEADDLETAIERAHRAVRLHPEAMTDINTIKTTVDSSSIQINEEEAEEINSKKNYTVRLLRKQWIEVSIEAHSLADAKRKAVEGAEDGSIEADSFELDEEIIAEHAEEI